MCWFTCSHSALNHQQTFNQTFMSFIRWFSHSFMLSQASNYQRTLLALQQQVEARHTRTVSRYTMRNRLRLHTTQVARHSFTGSKHASPSCEPQGISGKHVARPGSVGFGSSLTLFLQIYLSNLNLLPPCSLRAPEHHAEAGMPACVSVLYLFSDHPRR